MKKIFILVLFTLLPVFSGCGYNEMQALEEAVFRASGDLDSALQRRNDLIPNLVATVKGYASHEKETLEAVISARSDASSVKLDSETLNDPQAMAKFQKAQSSLSSALSRLMVVVEKYPELKASEQFAGLSDQLEGCENRINVARTRYNEAVEKFNYSIRKFPNSMVNSIFLNLERKEFFKADEAAKQVPKVEF